MRDAPLRRYFGVLLSLIGTSATVWLAATGRLALYIHPRYVVFTTVMSVIAAILILASFALLPDSADHPQPSRRRGSSMAILGCLGFAALALLLVPPSTLSVETAQQREVNQTLGSTTMTSSSLAAPTDADYSHFRLRDWAAAIQLAAKPGVIAGRPFDGTGFVSPTGAHRSDLFYLTRFVVTCCAVDAQPVGVPISEAGWRGIRTLGSWVHVKGVLGPDPRDPSRSVVIPTSIVPIHEPDQPYEH